MSFELFLTNLVTIGSAAWLGPHLPNWPRPVIPVLPFGLIGRPSTILYKPSWLRLSFFLSSWFQLDAKSRKSSGSAHDYLYMYIYMNIYMNINLLIYSRHKLNKKIIYTGLSLSILSVVYSTGL